MKKNILLLVALLAFIPAVSFADGDTATEDSYQTGVVTLGSTDTLEISTSNQVHISYDAGDSGVTYAVTTYHNNGDRTYMSSSEDATIYYAKGKKTGNPGAPTVGTPVGSAESDFPNTL